MEPSQMTQNIYDNDAFFDRYSKLPRSQKGLDGAPEWPILRDMVGDVSDCRVLDLGCGYGWFVQWARNVGAAKMVHGVDISSKMLERAAQEHQPDAAITYALGDLESIELPRGSYQVIYSSLTLHYLQDVRRIIKQIHSALIPQGRFVFSVEHPIYTAPTRPSFEKRKDNEEVATATSSTIVTDGQEGGENDVIWPLDSYGKEGLRVTNWLTEGVRKYHRTIDTYLTELLSAGFTLTAFKEWMPSETDLREHPEWKNEQERPMFLLIAAQAATK